MKRKSGFERSAEDFSEEHRRRFTHPEGILLACQYGAPPRGFSLPKDTFTNWVGTERTKVWRGKAIVGRKAMVFFKGEKSFLERAIEKWC